MGRYVNRRPVEVNIAAPQENHIPIYDTSSGLWSTVDVYSIVSNQSGSSNIQGNLVVSGSITTLGGLTGSVDGTASVALTVLQDNFTGSFTGSFIGDGSDLFFTKLSTYNVSDNILIVGNEYNNYENIQTTVFRNGNVVVSGSTTISSDGLLILSPRDAPDPPISGGMFYSSSGEFFVGTE